MGPRVAIIGLGPGGIAAAIQLHRYGIRPRIYEPSETPSLLKNANLVENYPGFPQGIPGGELYGLFREQLSRHSPDILRERVERVLQEGDGFIVDTGENAGRFDSVIISTGTRPIELDIGHPAAKVFYEVAKVPEDCNNVIVLGGGDAAFDYSLNLWDRGKEVTLVCRGERPKCLDLLEKRCSDAGVDVILGTAVVSVEGTESNISVELSTGRRIEADCLLCALGRVPVLDMLDKDLRQILDNGGHVKGLFLVGDVGNGPKRQVGIAVGDGLRAAMDIMEMMG
jgi:thioredoxin reductase